MWLLRSSLIPRIGRHPINDCTAALKIVWTDENNSEYVTLMDVFKENAEELDIDLYSSSQCCRKDRRDEKKEFPFSLLPPGYAFRLKLK